MRFLAHLLIAITIALILGFGLSWVALTDGRWFGVTQVGPWQTWAGAGSPTPDPYSRAYIARTAALQLGSSEGLAFLATNDSDGRPLTRSCRYRIDGSTPVASFWTLTPVDLEGGLIAVPGTPTHFSSRRLARANDGAVELYVSRSLAPRNWLEIQGEGPFALALNLYDVSDLGGGATPVAMPTILREACA